MLPTSGPHFFRLPTYPELTPPVALMAVVNGQIIGNLLFVKQPLEVVRYVGTTGLPTYDRGRLWVATVGPARILDATAYGTLYRKWLFRQYGYTGATANELVVLSNGVRAQADTVWRMYVKLHHLAQTSYPLLDSLYTSLLNMPQSRTHHRPDDPNQVLCHTYKFTNEDGTVLSTLAMLLRPTLTRKRGVVRVVWPLKHWTFTLD